MKTPNLEVTSLEVRYQVDEATLKIILKNFSVGAIKAELDGALSLTSEDDPSSLTCCSSRLGPLALVLLMIPKVLLV